MTRRSWSLLLATLFGALLTLVLPAAPASAHALLQRTAPVAGGQAFGGLTAQG